MLKIHGGNHNLRPPILALFQKRIEGDDALLELARLRFKEAGLGTEFYADNAEALEKMLQFKPSPQTPAVVHLSRELNVFLDESQIMIIDLAQRFKKEVFGFVIHDQVEMAESFDDYSKAISKLAQRLEAIKNSPCLFVEYAVGVSLDLFVQLFETLIDCRGIGCCVDTGHVGLWQARQTYAANILGSSSDQDWDQDVCALSPDHPELPKVVAAVQSAVKSSVDAVNQVVQALGKTKKPVHFHLHDGHPVSTLNPLGISDHLSFLEKIPIPFEYLGKRHLEPMFGPKGLAKIIDESLKQLGTNQVSFSLEIHPTEGRLPLKDYEHLFTHWHDKTFAEKMNYWLEVLIENHQLVQKLLCRKKGMN